MGVDQYTAWHRFDPLSDGGRIALQLDPKDTSGTLAIRAQLRDVARRFASGDFAIPGFVHAREVAGTRAMRAKRSAIFYLFHRLAGGGEVRIITGDSDAVAAVHEFLAFQRQEHHVH
jgi:hypothetical protein